MIIRGPLSAGARFNVFIADFECVLPAMEERAMIERQLTRAEAHVVQGETYYLADRNRG